MHSHKNQEILLLYNSVEKMDFGSKLFEKLILIHWKFWLNVNENNKFHYTMKRWDAMPSKIIL